MNTGNDSDAAGFLRTDFTTAVFGAATAAGAVFFFGVALPIFTVLPALRLMSNNLSSSDLLSSDSSVAASPPTPSAPPPTASDLSP